MYINETPVKTWYWLNLNGVNVNLASVDSKSKKEIECDVKESNFDLDYIDTGMGKNFSNFVLESPKDIKSFEFEKDGCLVIRYTSKTCACDVLNLSIKENANVSVYMIFDSEDLESGCQYITTKACIDKNAKLKLYQISKLNVSSVLVSDIGVVCEENTNFEPHLLYLGSKKTYAGMKTDLNGDNSSLNCNSAYFGFIDKEYDFNYFVNHYGKKTNSEIFVDGSLDQKAKKTFKGTIDFKTGSSGSVGLERENVLLLGEETINNTLPIILCSEEDVQGNHGASIGGIDEQIMFYLQSRGLSEEQVKVLMTDSMIKSKIKKIELDEIKNETDEYFTVLLNKRYETNNG